MPQRRKKKNFQQLTKLEGIIGLREEGFSYRVIADRVQRSSSTMMRVYMLWTNEYRTTRKTGNG